MAVPSETAQALIEESQRRFALRTPQRTYAPSVEDLKAESQDAPSLLDSFLAGVEVDNSGARFLDWISGPGYAYDPDWTADSLQEWIKTNGERIAALPNPEEVGEMLGSSLNLDHAEALLTKAEEEFRLEQEANANFMARMAANLFDPIDLAVAGIAGPAGAAVRVTRLSRAVRAGVAAGAANAAIEGVAASQSPFRGAADVGYAALFGLAIGAPLGSLGRVGDVDIDRRIRDLAEDAAKEVYEDSAGAMRRVLNTEGSTDRMSPLAPRSREKVEDMTEDLPEPGEFRYETLQKIQRNYIGKLFFSKDPLVRKVSASILEGGHLRDNLETRGHTAEGRARLIQRVFKTNLMASTRQDFLDWSKARGYGWWGREVGTKAGEEFYTEVGLALKGFENVSPQARAAAQKVRPLLDDIYKMAAEAGVKGFDREALADYFPRVYSSLRWREKLDEFGEDGLVDFYKEAILNASAKYGDDIDDDLAEKIARGYVRAVTRGKGGMDMSMTHGIPLDDMDMLREMLNPVNDPHGENLVDEIVSIIERRKAKRNKDAGNNVYARTRLRFDETYSAPVRRRDGTVGHLSMSDLVENDARKVLFRYADVMSGDIGLAKHAGIKSKADVDALKKAIQDRAIAEGRDATDEINALEEAINLVTGRGIDRDPFSFWSMFSRAMGAFNYLQYGGGFGVAQIPEMGNLVGFATIRGFMRYMPEYAKVLKRARSGELELPLARTMEQLMAPGTDLIRNPALARFDEFGYGYSDSWFGRAFSKIDPAIASGGRLTAILSLMAPINAAMQRAAGLQWAARVADWATDRVKLGDDDIARLRGAGISPEMQDRIFKSLRESAVYKGDKLVDIDVSKWTDVEALDSFRMSGHREMRNILQENDLGNTGGFVHRPLGRMLTTFMSFMMNSINKQLLRGVQYHDIQTFVSWSSAMFFAGLAYIGQTYADYANDPKKLEERLEPMEIAKAAFARAGFAAVLVPTIDNALAFTGFDPWFSHARTSGLGTTLLTSTPAITALQDVYGTARLPLALLHDDYRFSQEDADRIWRLMPFHRLLGVRNAYAALTADLPERSRTDD